MNLSKSQIEQVKYHATKKNPNIQLSNDDIRLSARQFETFDRDAIVNSLTSMTLVETDLAVIEQNPNKTALTAVAKQELIKIESAQIGIELTEIQITDILNSTNQEFFDSLEFLQFARDIIKELMVKRNNKRQNTRLETVSSIVDVINSANQEDAQNALKTNQILVEMVEQNKSVSAKYINPYSANKQALQKILSEYNTV